MLKRATRRQYGRAWPGRHEAWIDRRSPRTAQLLRAMRRGDDGMRPTPPARATNDNAAGLAD